MKVNFIALILNFGTKVSLLLNFFKYQIAFINLNNLISVINY